MAKQFDQELAISKNILEKLQIFKSENLINSFHLENQLQYNIIAIYILSEKNKTFEFHQKFKKYLNELTNNFLVDVNILYNYIEDNKMYDMEFLQGREEIMQGYSTEYFGDSASISDNMDIDYYEEISRNRS
jgi:hypothetical protein